MIFELIAALGAVNGFKLGFLKVSRDLEHSIEQPERDGLDSLRELGVDILEPVQLPPNPPVRALIAKTLTPELRDFYPEIVNADLVAAKVDAFKADVVLVPWSEWATALCANVPAKRFAYYGNPDPKAAIMRARFDYKHGGSTFRYLKTMIGAQFLRRAHLDVMMRYDWVGNVAANDVEFYRENGHKNAFYIQNLWIDRFGAQWRELREATELGEPVQVVANVGKLFGTANRCGLEYLSEMVLPTLREIFEPGQMTLDIMGSGEPPIELKSLFESPEVRRLGFVPDIDYEILRRPLFLCVNNATQYKVGHTRYLHAWSLGAGVIAHQDAALSMPEMVHQENCLLGSSGKEIAELIHEASKDKILRRRIGEAGYETFKERFSPKTVAESIAARIC